MKVFASFICIALIIFVIGFVWYVESLTPVSRSSSQEQLFVIPKGITLRQIADKLYQEKLIKNPIAFLLFAKFSYTGLQIQAGDYKLSSSMSVEKIVSTLQHGTLDVWITIPEGYRAEEIAALLQKSLKNYSDSWVSELKKENGYLFPDTYLLPTDASVETVISILKNNFNKKIMDENIPQATLSSTVIIASLIEREARFPSDRPLVSSVIHNRLADGMSLQIDATVQYLLGFNEAEKSWWKKNLTKEDLETVSAYNTYKVVGLPPAPISNPGILSLKAAVSYPQTSYFYYVSDKNGHLHFATTHEDHVKNISKYIE